MNDNLAPKRNPDKLWPKSSRDVQSDELGRNEKQNI